MNEVKDVLSERDETHGDFRVQFVIAQRIKYAFGDYGNCSPVQREALDVIAHKISRIIAGNSNFKDHWLDIAGYASCILKDL